MSGKSLTAAVDEVRGAMRRCQPGEHSEVMLAAVSLDSLEALLKALPSAPEPSELAEAVACLEFGLSHPERQYAIELRHLRTLARHVRADLAAKNEQTERLAALEWFLEVYWFKGTCSFEGVHAESASEELEESLLSALRAVMPTEART